MKKIVIVGGGASGMICAASLAEIFTKNNLDLDHVQVFLLEKNSNLGAKVIISGGGRCNVTTGVVKIADLLKKYIRGADFLDPIVRKYTPKKIYNRFEDHGVKLKTEQDLRVFPVSNDGHEVVGAFENVFSESSQTEVKYKFSVKSIKYENGFFEIKSDNETISDVDYLVLATGGAAYRHTGSTGDGYSFAESLGHTVTPLGPSLSSLVFSDTSFFHLAGTAIEKAVFQRNGHKVEGPMLFTHRGVSGPAVFALSSYLAFSEISQTYPQKINLALLPGFTADGLEKIILEEQTKNPNKHLKSLFYTRFSKKLSIFLLEKLFKNSEIKFLNLTKEDRKRVCKTLTNGLEIEIIGRKPGDEFVTAGGVLTSEIDNKTCESKIVKNLFIVGELLDVDGVTGGFNLQSCWSTGLTAADEILKKVLG